MKNSKNKVIVILMLVFIFAGITVIPQQNVNAATYDVIVAKDGTGNFTTITEAYNSLTTPTDESKRKTIYVKNGTYKEKLTISKPYITIIGESKSGTKLTYDAANGVAKPTGDAYGSADCAALIVSANDFNARNITFENSYLKDTGKDVQASCVYTYGDRIVFDNCGFYSGQDTLCLYTYGANKSRVYLNNCFIQGDVDFIWGGAVALFNNCTLNNIRDKAAYTAANTPIGQKYGYVFLNCTLTANGDTNYTSKTSPAWGTPTTVYLGRTYGDYCHVTYINCALNAPVNSLGWQKMSNNVNNTAKLEEYGCNGIGANRSGRVSWSNAITETEAADYTKSKVLAGSDGWNPINSHEVIVAKDGTGDFTTITAAYNSLSTPTDESKRKTIYVKNGTYKEKLTISKPYISIIGESKSGTKLTYDAANGVAKPGGGIYGSADCAALIVAANDFHAQDITFENSYLKDTGKDVQASCVYTYADRIVFDNCGFYSGQDTLCLYTYGVNKSRVYLNNCFIQGDVDFIWGGAVALFNNCTLNNIRDKAAYTAANTPIGQKYGYVFLNCTLTANGDTNYTSKTSPAWGTPTTVYLGRTYGDYCHVTYINCALNAPVNSLGWQKMNNNVNNTAKLEEYGCNGIGANRLGRVNWSNAITETEAADYTKSKVLTGSDGWNPITLDEPTILYGDLNGDKIINISDYVLMKLYINGTIESFSVTSKAADLDGNSSIDKIDNLLMKDFLLHKISDFPVNALLN